MINQWRHIIVKAGKDKAAITLYFRRFGQPEFSGRELRWLAFNFRHVNQAASTIKYPAVVGADKKFLITAGRFAQGHAAVFTGVDHHVQVAGFIPAQNHRFGTDGSGFKITRVSNFTLMTHVNPGAMMDVCHLQIEHLRVHKQVTVHPVFFYQRWQSRGAETFIGHHNILDNLFNNQSDKLLMGTLAWQAKCPGSCKVVKIKIRHLPRCQPRHG